MGEGGFCLRLLILRKICGFADSIDVVDSNTANFLDRILSFH